MKNNVLLIFLFCLTIFSCKNENSDTNDWVEKQEIIEETDVLSEKVSISALKEQLKSEGFEIFDYVDEETGDTIIMQQYYIAFLKRGPNRDQTEDEAAKLQEGHMAHLGRMYEEGYADISGPFGDDGDIRGITIYNVPTLQMADSLANLDPAVKAGRLMIEVHPWWAAKGFPLR